MTIIEDTPIPKGFYYVGGTKEGGVVISDNKADENKYQGQEIVGTDDIIGNQFANFLVHTFSPLLVTLDYFLFDEKGNFKYFYPFIWLILPLNYIVYVYTYSSMGGKFYSIGGSRHFAYFFLDYEKIGYIGVLKWIIAMAIFILMIGLGFVVLDKLLARIRARK